MNELLLNNIAKPTQLHELGSPIAECKPLVLTTIGNQSAGTFVRAVFKLDHDLYERWFTWTIIDCDKGTVGLGIQPYKRQHPPEFCFLAKIGVCYTILCHLHATPTPNFLTVPEMSCIATIVPTTPAAEFQDVTDDLPEETKTWFQNRSMMESDDEFGNSEEMRFKHSPHWSTDKGKEEMYPY